MKKAIGIISAVYALFLPYIILSLISFLFDDIENMTRLKFILFLMTPIVHKRRPSPTEPIELLTYSYRMSAKE